MFKLDKVMSSIQAKSFAITFALFACVLALFAPDLAFAAGSFSMGEAQGIFDDAKEVISMALGVFAAFLIVWGLVQLGMSIRDGQGPGNTQALGSIAGGVLIALAAAVVMGI